mmetsp:Transcript_20881/g.53338  ORF Transcript_20881/g.53338 Transcript_20881/m.53338 type:complete len:161 (-) Transcript_20881:270-752(-)
MSMDEAVACVEGAGVHLDEEFVDFIEQCSVRRLRVCVLSRGLKPLIRAILRGMGIGHVEVLAHDMFVDQSTSEWRVSFRDDTPSGHDKAESMRRALRHEKPTSVLFVGRTACDFAPVQAGYVDCVVTPTGSALASLCDEAGVRTRAFVAWSDLSNALLGD